VQFDKIVFPSVRRSENVLNLNIHKVQVKAGQFNKAESILN